MLGILVLWRRMADSPAVPGTRLDPVGTLLSAAGLGLIVFGIIRSGTWGFVQPKPDAPQWLGLSPVIWLILGGAGILALFVLWENRQLRRGGPSLVDPRMLRVPKLQAGLTSFFFQFLLQAGIFFVIPLFLSVALGLSAVATGVRLLPLSVTLLAAAVGVPRLFPQASPRRVVRIGFGLLLLGIVVLLMALDAGAGPEVVTVAAAADRPRHREPGLPARCRHGVVGARRTERRGGWRPEHGDEPGRVHRHRPVRGHPHLGAHDDLPRVGRRQPGDPEGDVLPGPGGAVGGHPLRERRRPECNPREGRRPAGYRSRPSSTPTRRAVSTGSGPPWRCWRSSRWWPWP